MYSLSERLSLIASLVPKGARVCDIGTDHGYLAIHLKTHNIASSVIASDIREKPLNSARSNIEASGAKGIELRLCDGLTGIQKGEADTVIIAGMGGEVISGILLKCDWIKSEHITLILQPMTSAEDLRKYLAENGFEVLTEPSLKENGKLYSIIKAVYTGKPIKLDEYQYYIGKIDPRKKDGLDYIKKQYKRCASCASSLENVPEQKEHFEYYQTISCDLKKLIDQYGE